MHKWMTAVLSLAWFGLAVAAESAPKSPAKAQASKPAVANKPAVKPKYHYVRATPLAAAPMLPSPVADVQVQEAVAGDVHTGHMVCELGNSVTVTPDPQQPTRFIVQMKKNTYHMTPVATTTGAVRLEDAQAGAMWLQLPHKSMLMNSKLGQRMADECQNDHQTSVAHAMKLDPPPSLLDGPALAKK
ncbi:MAG: hypothetical protein ACR2IX_04050 [Limnohabitans sp.]